MGRAKFNRQCVVVLVSEADLKLQQILATLPHTGLLSTPSSIPTMLSSTDRSTATPIATIFPTATSPSVVSHTPRGVPPAPSSTDLARSEGSGHARSPQNIATGRFSEEQLASDQKVWPKLPGFAPPVSDRGTFSG